MRQVDIGHANLGESQPMGPRLKRRQNLCAHRLPVLIHSVPQVLTHPRILESRSLQWDDESHTEAFCQALAQRLMGQPPLRHAVIELEGDLGAGKTTTVRHLLRALGVQGRIKSPTYAVLEPYSLTLPDGQALAVSHFDFYRFSDPCEWEDAGFRDVFTAPGLKLCEWADKARAALPPPDLCLRLHCLDGTRRAVHLDAYSPIGQGLLP